MDGQPADAESSRVSLLARVLRPRNGIASSQDLAAEVGMGGLGRGLMTDTGKMVSADDAMRLTDVYAAVRVLAETVAQLPLIVYRRTGTTVKDRATDHWLYRLLHDAPNPWQTSFEFREMQQGAVGLVGNAYAIKTVVGQEVRELLPVPPFRVQVRQEPHPSYRITYDVTLPGVEKPLTVPQERMFHIPGLSFNGVTGLSPVAYQRELLGYTLSVQEFGSRIYKNQAHVAGVLQHPQLLSDQARKNLLESFDEAYSGVGNAHKTVLLEEGVSFTKTGMSARDAEFMAAMKFGKRQIATMFRIPPHLIGDLDNATFTNIEQQGIEFVVHSMGPWFKRWEQRIAKSLIPPGEQDTLFAEFLVDGLLRGDAAARGNYYQQLVQIGVLSPNEVRAKENWNPREGGDEYITPAFLGGQAGVTQLQKETPVPGKQQPKPPAPVEDVEQETPA